MDVLPVTYYQTKRLAFVSDQARRLKAIIFVTFLLHRTCQVSCVTFCGTQKKTEGTAEEANGRLGLSGAHHRRWHIGYKDRTPRLKDITRSCYNL